MADRLKKIRVIDEVLTNVCHGFSNGELVGSELFPFVSVNKEGGKIPMWGKEAFKLARTERALRAKSNRTEGGWLELIDYVLTEHDLAQEIDYRELEEAWLQLEAKAATEVMNRLLLGLEKKQAELATALTTYSDGHKVTLSSGSYLDDASIDPIEYLRSCSDELAKSIAKKANTMVMPTRVMQKILIHPKVKAYLTLTSEVKALADIDKLKTLTGIPNIKEATALYNEDGSDVFSEVWGNNIVMAYVTPPPPIARTPYEPCFGYTLRKNGYPYADKWDEENGKITVVRASDMFSVKVVGPDSGYLIKDAITPSVYNA